MEFPITQLNSIQQQGDTTHLIWDSKSWILIACSCLSDSTAILNSCLQVKDYHRKQIVKTNQVILVSIQSSENFSLLQLPARC